MTVGNVNSVARKRWEKTLTNWKVTSSANQKALNDAFRCPIDQVLFDLRDWLANSLIIFSRKHFKRLQILKTFNAIIFYELDQENFSFPDQFYFFFFRGSRSELFHHVPRTFSTRITVIDGVKYQSTLLSAFLALVLQSFNRFSFQLTLALSSKSFSRFQNFFTSSRACAAPFIKPCMPFEFVFFVIV